ncbi:MAG: redox-sensing transcriptional repressor Rex [Candidatus Omnitrophica bacterium]|nr:redox-sensing transcriptional repressor Rex [Candidatus Omnitrophota bacterium]MDD3274190.1 redox-sensing transcriptional repressor Rex [Candidatus Omnitrophota bacterium]MDD5078064.1 redox-sensing transcriptional repressor Rex [Candidatus Omnitrophota bacterium]MDD5725013.1 redox-sensing transcriptional repressor Rex [Candidatus Omnitrophota bacterium]
MTNKNCIIRLSRYKNALYRLQALGFVKVFSDNLADAVGVTASQVRKDFSIFGISGNKKGGYQIDLLLEKLNNILGKDRLQKVIVVGGGHIGSALMRYRGFEKEGIKIIAGFDIDPAKINRSNPVPILPLEEARIFIKTNGIRIAILAVPDIAAQQALDLICAAGIKGVLNFAPLRLKAPESCIVNYVNLEIELENLIYFVNVAEKTE